tara:strand:- start:370 stop:585 length:216 start_codon:yes stop_codon:yes gene_type:complete
MLKVNTGTVIEGIFSDDKYIDLVKESDFSTLIIHIDIKDFEDKCIEVVTALAENGKVYAEDYVIARASYES